MLKSVIFAILKLQLLTLSSRYYLFESLNIFALEQKYYTLFTDSEVNDIQRNFAEKFVSFGVT